MDILQKHSFYVGLGAVLGVYFLIYVILIAPMSKTITRESGKLSGMLNKMKEYSGKPSLPNEEVVNYHEQQKSLLNENLQKVLSFYSKRDEGLEKWFPEIAGKLQKNSTTVPELDFFQAVYQSERQALINKYADPKCPFVIAKRVDIVDPSPQGRMQEVQDILPLKTPSKIVTESDMKTAQKEFWLLQGILEILEQSKLKVLTNLRFVREYEAPGVTGATFIVHAVEFSGAIDYPDVSFFVHELLNNKKNFMVELGGVSIQRDRQHRPKVTKIVLLLGESEKDGLERWKQQNQGKQTFPPVFINMGLRILDYQQPEKTESGGN
jgi:hypothetical protein